MYIYMSTSPDPHQPFLPPAIGDAIRTPSPSVINPSSISPSICTWGGLGGPGGLLLLKGLWEQSGAAARRKCSLRFYNVPDSRNSDNGVFTWTADKYPVCL